MEKGNIEQERLKSVVKDILKTFSENPMLCLSDPVRKNEFADKLSKIPSDILKPFLFPSDELVDSLYENLFELPAEKLFSLFPFFNFKRDSIEVMGKSEVTDFIRIIVRGTFRLLGFKFKNQEPECQKKLIIDEKLKFEPYIRKVILSEFSQGKNAKKPTKFEKKLIREILFTEVYGEKFAGEWGNFLVENNCLYLQY